MKNTYLTLALLASCFGANAQIFSDNFDGYAVGSYLGPQSLTWSTWSGTEGGAEDATITAAQSSSNPHSIYFSSTSANGGPQDVILKFGQLYNSGIFTLRNKFYVNTGKTGYYNIQANMTVGTLWALNVNLNAGQLIIDDGITPNLVVCPYPQATWFDLKIEANLTIHVWKAYINNVLVGTWVNGVNTVASTDFFPVQNTQMYIDDVSFDHQTYVLPNLNAMVADIDMGGEIVGQTVAPNVKVLNAGSTAITSFKVDFTYNGVTQTQTITGVNLATAALNTVTFPTVTLAAGNQAMTATVYEINGALNDDVLGDNVLVEYINPIVPAAGKMVVGEEATGTWCQWCPRGAVFMDLYETKYADLWAGIAVHNGDPMTVTDYDAGIGTLIGGYPSALVDRLGDVDPSGMSSDFFTRIQTPPAATIINGANWDATSRVLNVSVKYTFPQSANGLYKSVCVLTENAVTGTGSGYNQSNAYAGGGNGVMGGFQSLPNPVPAAQMVYDHVARAIAPSFGGNAGVLPTNITAGANHIVNYSFTLPTTWDENEMDIVGMLIDPTGKIDNAGSANIATAIANGFETGLNAGTEMQTFGALDAQVSMFPNPTNTSTQITFNLKAVSDVSIELFDLNGKSMMSASYEQLVGGQTVNMNTETLQAGVYLVEIQINGDKQALRLVVE